VQIADGTVRRVTCPGCCVEEHVVENMTCENVNSTSSASHQAAFKLLTQGCMNLPDKVALQMLCSVCVYERRRAVLHQIARQGCIAGKGATRV